MRGNRGLRKLAIALASAAALGAAAPAMAQDALNCSFFQSHLQCSYPGTEYHVRQPQTRLPGRPTPSIVVYHDAGSDGRSLLESGLFDRFVDEGFALIAPTGLPRENMDLVYDERRPGIIEAGRTSHPITSGNRSFVLEGRGGEVRTLEWGADTGWYYYNIDRIEYEGGDSDYIGRDEIGELRRVLADAETQFGIDPHPSLIVGIGHGGALVWQMACYAPDLADLFAPVGGGFWDRVPSDCRPGARLVHSHRRAGPFWPLDGSDGSKRRYARTSIFDDLEALLQANNCSLGIKSGGRDSAGISRTAWTSCSSGGPIELIVTENDPQIPLWWVDEIRDKSRPSRIEMIEGWDQPARAGPSFASPGDSTGPAFKRPGAAAGEDDRTGPSFRSPGAGTASPFKRVK